MFWGRYLHFILLWLFVFALHYKRVFVFDVSPPPRGEKKPSIF